MFYDRFKQLCELRGVSVSTAATMARINKSSVTYWKKQRDAGKEVIPAADVINRLCEFFHCTRADLLETEKGPTVETVEPNKLELLHIYD